MSFWISLILSSAVTYCVLRHLKRKRERIAEEEERAMAEAASLSAKRMADIVRMRIEHQMRMAYATAQYEMHRLDLQIQEAERIAREARAMGAIDSTCVEVQPKKRLH